MSVYRHVKHFLNQEGKGYFPKWFHEATCILSEQPGFMGAKFAYDKEDPECVHLWFEFENADMIRDWANSDIHNEVVGKLSPYRTRKLTVDKFDIEATVAN